MSSGPIVYRRIDPIADADLAYSNYRDACIASFGNARSCQSKPSYLSWLTERAIEFPDGNLIATIGSEPIGQLELQVPYGSLVGYVNLFCVMPAWRRLGLGTLLHQRGEQYFRSWEAKAVDLHVTPANTAALAFYRRQGYRLVEEETEGGRMWKMRLHLK